MINRRLFLKEAAALGMFTPLGIAARLASHVRMRDDPFLAE
jgi:hypothetical protein